MPWGDVLALAHAPTERHAHLLGRRQTRSEQNWLTEDHIAYVLRLVARQTERPTLTPTHYRIERARMLALDHSHWLHGRRLRLPTDEQLHLAAGGWDHALALAGLNARPGLGDQGHGRLALGTVELLERCYAAHGTQPSALELRRFARANGVPWNPDKDRTWLESVAAWKEQHRAQGLPVPDGPPPRSDRPDYTQPIGAAQAGEQRRHNWSRIDDCLPYVIAYLEQLAPGERSTKLGYAAWASQQYQSPNTSAFDQHGGWEVLRRSAQAQVLHCSRHSSD
jgi:hypothetical protein